MENNANNTTAKTQAFANGSNYTGIGVAVVQDTQANPSSQESRQQQSQNQQDQSNGNHQYLQIYLLSVDKDNEAKKASQIKNNQLSEQQQQNQDIDMKEEDKEQEEKADKDGNVSSSEMEEDGQQLNNNVGTTTRSGGQLGGVKKVDLKVKKPTGQTGLSMGQGGNRKKPFKSVLGGSKRPITVGEQIEMLSQMGGDDFNPDSDFMFQQQIPAQPAFSTKNFFFVKQRFLYKPFIPLPNLQDYLQELIEVRIFAPYLTKFNKAYLKRNFYGTDIYTSDSDAVCILQHVNYYKVTEEEPTDFEAISVYFRVVKGRNNYPSTQRYGIRSRKMGQFDGHSLKFESAEFQKNLGSLKELCLMSQVMPTHLEPVELHHQRKTQLKNRLICSRIPDSAYKAITPALVFNLSLETAYQFNLSTFADKSDDLTGRTCQKLQDNVLYIETDQERFEICKQAGGISEGQSLKYRFSRIKQPQMMDNAFFHANKRPLEENFIQVIARDLDWTEFHWGEKSVIVKDQRIYPLKNYKYYPTNEKKGQ